MSSAKRQPFCLALNVLKDVDFFKAATEISRNLMTLWLLGSQLLFPAVTTPYCIIFSICIKTSLSVDLFDFLLEKLHEHFRTSAVFSGEKSNELTDQ